MADQFYFESDYIADDYFGYVAEAEISLSGAFSPTFTVAVADDTGYFIPEYIETDYFALAVTEADATLSSQATISVDATRIHQGDSNLSSAGTISTTGLRIKQLEADFGALFTPSFSAVGRLNSTAILDSSATLTATVSPIRDNDSTLNNIVNLSLQGVKTADHASAFSSAFTQTANDTYTRGIEANLNTSSTLLAVTGILSIGGSDFTENTHSVTTTLTATVGKLQSASTSISAVATQSTNAIEYVTKTLNFSRPNNFVAYQYSGFTNSWSTNTGSSQFVSAPSPSAYYGSYAVEPLNNPLVYLGSALAATTSNITMGSQDFYINMYFRQNDTNVDTFNDTVFASFGSGFNSIVDSGAATPILKYPNADGKINIGLSRVDNTFSQLTAWIQKSDGTYLELRDTQSLTTLTGNVTLRRNGNDFELYRGNTLADSATYTGSLVGGTYNQFTLYPTEFETNEPTFDRVVFKVGTAGVAGTPSSITNDDDTVLYHQFEQTLNDETGLTLTGAASLDSAFSLSFLGGGIFEFATLQASAGTLTCNANAIFDHTSSQDSAASLSVETGFLVDFSADFDAFNSQVTAINKIGNTLVALDNAFTLAADVNEIVQLQASLSAAFTQNIDESFILNYSADLSSAASLSVDISGGFIGLAEQTMSSAFTQTVDGLRIRPGDVDLDSAFTQSTTATKTVDISLTLNSQFTQSTDAQRFRDVEADFDAFNTQLTAINKIGQGLMGFDGIFSFSIDPIIIAQGGLAFASRATISADVGVIKQGQSTQSSAVTVVANATSSQDARADLDSAFTISTDANQIKGVEADLDSAVTQTVDVNRIRDFDIDLSGAFTPSITVEAFTDFEADLSATFTQSTNAGKQVDAVINFGALFTPSIDYRIIHVDQYVYTVPAETRTFTIHSESRSYTVPQETRTYTIQGD